MKIILQQPREEDILYQYEYCVYAISRSFYQELRLYILPYFPYRLRNKIVYFPKIPSFINYLKTNRNYSVFSIDTQLKNEILKLHKELSLKYQVVSQRKYEQIKQFIPQLEQDISKIFHGEKLPDQIVISQSLWGIGGIYTTSFGTLKEYIRIDNNLDALVTLTTQAIIKTINVPNENLNISSKLWEKYQLLMEEK